MSIMTGYNTYTTADEFEAVTYFDGAEGGKKVVATVTIVATALTMC